MNKLGIMDTFPFDQYIMDENIPYKVILELRKVGIDVKSVLELILGKSDEEIMNYAYQNNLVIATFDSDFGELVFRNKIKTLGVLYFRIPLTSPDLVFNYLRNYFKNNHHNPLKKFIIITKSIIRIRNI